MAEEPFALSTVGPPSQDESDYEAICATVMESARGRWFLEEYARRNRQADTALVLAAINRLEGVIKFERAAQGSVAFRTVLLEMARTIAEARAPAAEALEGDAHGRNELASAHAEILAAAERIHDVAWTMRERGMDPATCQEIETLASSILTTRSPQRQSDPGDARVERLSGVLQDLEQRLHAILDASEPGHAVSAGMGEHFDPSSRPSEALEAMSVSEAVATEAATADQDITEQASALGHEPSGASAVEQLATECTEVLAGLEETGTPVERGDMAPELKPALAQFNTEPDEVPMRLEEASPLADLHAEPVPPEAAQQAEAEVTEPILTNPPTFVESSPQSSMPERFEWAEMSFSESVSPSFSAPARAARVEEGELEPPPVPRPDAPGEVAGLDNPRAIEPPTFVTDMPILGIETPNRPPDPVAERSSQRSEEAALDVREEPREPGLPSPFQDLGLDPLAGRMAGEGGAAEKGISEGFTGFQEQGDQSIASGATSVAPDPTSSDEEKSAANAELVAEIPPIAPESETALCEAWRSGRIEFSAEREGDDEAPLSAQGQPHAPAQHIETLTAGPESAPEPVASICADPIAAQPAADEPASAIAQSPFMPEKGARPREDDARTREDDAPSSSVENEAAGPGAETAGSQTQPSLTAHEDVLSGAWEDAVASPQAQAAHQARLASTKPPEPEEHKQRVTGHAAAAVAAAASAQEAASADGSFDPILEIEQELFAPPVPEPPGPVQSGCVPASEPPPLRPTQDLLPQAALSDASRPAPMMPAAPIESVPPPAIEPALPRAPAAALRPLPRSMPRAAPPDPLAALRAMSEEERIALFS